MAKKRLHLERRSGLQVKGAKLSDDQVREIRKRKNKLGHTCEQIAKDMNVHASTVAQIANYRKRSNVPDLESED